MSSVDTREVVVVGAGPAGSALAALLADEGRDVTVLERRTFPRRKPCGEAINPAGVRALGRIGFLEAILEQEPARLHGWDIRTDDDRGGTAWYDEDRTTFGLGISRDALDAVLADGAVERGADVRFGVTVRRIEHGRDGRHRIVTRSRESGEGEIFARIVVGADGLRSMVAPAIGVVRRAPKLRKVSLTTQVAGTGPPPDRGYLRILDDCTVGMAPIDRDGSRWNATVVVSSERDGRALAEDPEAFFRERLERFGPRSELGWQIEAPPLASGPFDRPTRRVWNGSVLLIGDASGYYDPLTGQGITRAIRSAELAAPVVVAALDGASVRSAPFRRYASTYRRTFGPGRVFQYVVEAATSRSSVRRWLLSRIGRTPRLATSLIRVIGDLASPSTLLAPRVLGLLLSPSRGGHSENYERWAPHENRR